MLTTLARLQHTSSDQRAMLAIGKSAEHRSGLFQFRRWQVCGYHLRPNACPSLSLVRNQTTDEPEP